MFKKISKAFSAKKENSHKKSCCKIEIKEAGEEQSSYPQAGQKNN